MFFKPKPQQSPNAIHYFVSFLSPYFLLYIKCPKQSFWQLARTQEDPKAFVDGTTERLVHPVLLFSSRYAAEEYATENLGLQPKKVAFPDSTSFSLWRKVEQFEAVTFPVETIPVQKTISIAPVLYVKDQSTQVNTVHTLPFVERRRN